MNHPVYCPFCRDYDPPYEIKLDLSSDESVLYCSGIDGENPCGFHYDLVTGRTFHYEQRKHQWFWVLIAVFSLFLVNRCFRKVYDL